MDEVPEVHVLQYPGNVVKDEPFIVGPGMNGRWRSVPATQMFVEEENKTYVAFEKIL